MSSELLLHPSTAKQLASLLEHPAHAVLILGAEGAGKSALALHIAEQLLAVNDVTSHPYVMQLDANGSDGIAQVREIRKFLSLKAAGQQTIRRVVIVENVDHLGGDAQNALLKTLEEPPTDTVLLLTACQKGQVLQTIRSRVHALPILPLTEAVCLAHSGYGTAELKKAYALSGGLAGAFLALLEVEAEHPRAKSVALAKDFLAKSAFERLSLADALAKDREELNQLLSGLETCLHAALRQGKDSSLKGIHAKLAYVDKTRRAFEHSANAKLLLTSLAITL